jgi:ABC-2 type transport system ATP-binding protein
MNYQSAIQLVNLTKKFNNLTAIDHINLEVKRGEIIGFLGPNGAGKTTTVKILAGLIFPTEGNAYIMNYNTQKDMMKIKEILGFIPDRPYIYEKLTGYEFLQFTAGIYNVNNIETNKKIDELLEMFELTNWRNELIENYSHGMKQKLVIISTLIHNPQVLIIDEPMVGLDPKSVVILKEIFKNLARKNNTIFLSTHSMEIVEKLCTRIAIIKEGKLIAYDTFEGLNKISEKNRLEDIFLELTGSPDVREIIKYL